MEPNYRFENEISEQYQLRNFDFRDHLRVLLVKYISITQKEYDVLMWIGCNLPYSSPVRKHTIKSIKEMLIVQKNIEKGNLQIIMDL